MALNLKGMEGLFSGLSRCWRLRQHMLVKLFSARLKEEVLTTWRASLATLGVVVRNRHCGRLDSFEAFVTFLKSRGKALEAILDAVDAQNCSLCKELSSDPVCHDFQLHPSGPLEPDSPMT